MLIFITNDISLYSGDEELMETYCYTSKFTLKIKNNTLYVDVQILGNKGDSNFVPVSKLDKVEYNILMNFMKSHNNALIELLIDDNKTLRVQSFT